MIIEFSRNPQVHRKKQVLSLLKDKRAFQSFHIQDLQRQLYQICGLSFAQIPYRNYPKGKIPVQEQNQPQSQKR